MCTIVVNKYKDTFDVDISRKSKWGNPFSHSRTTSARIVVDDRNEAINRYEKYLLSRPELIFDLPELCDKKLGCTCKPKSCHGDILCAILANFLISESEVDESVFW